MKPTALSPEIIARYCHLRVEPVKPPKERKKPGPHNHKHPELDHVPKGEYQKFYMRWWRRFSRGLRRPIQFYEFRDGLSLAEVAAKHDMTVQHVEDVVRKAMR